MLGLPIISNGGALRKQRQRCRLLAMKAEELFVSSQYFGAILREVSMLTPDMATNLPEAPLVIEMLQLFNEINEIFESP